MQEVRKHISRESLKAVCTIFYTTCQCGNNLMVIVWFAICQDETMLLSAVGIALWSTNYCFVESPFVRTYLNWATQKIISCQSILSSVGTLINIIHLCWAVKEDRDNITPSNHCYATKDPSYSTVRSHRKNMYLWLDHLWNILSQVIKLSETHHAISKSFDMHHYTTHRYRYICIMF